MENPYRPVAPVLIGDAERDHYTSLLSEHFAAGRLPDAEFQHRMARALSARSSLDLAELVDRNKDATRLLMVGHNPGFEQLAALMHSGQTGDYRGMPPGGIAVLALPADAGIEPGIAQLTAFWWP